MGFTMRKALLRSLVHSGRDNTWFSWAAVTAFFVVGAMCRALVPESGVVPLGLGLVAAAAVGRGIYKLEFAGSSK